MWLLHLCFCYHFEQAHFVMFNGLLFILFVKLLVFVCKDENLVTFLFIHTIQLTLTVSKLHPFFCVLPSLQFEKLKHCPILLMLD